jgi:tetratricopeptide (TPR) repeat protein
METASVLDPLWFICLQIYNWELPFARRFEKALEINDRAAALRSDPFIPLRGERARILLALGRRDDAVEVARFILRNLNLEPRWHADVVAVWVLQQAGHTKEAADFAAELFTRWSPDSYRRGFLLGALGRFDEALPYLGRTPVVLFRSFFWEEIWAPWRQDARFRELLVKLGCADEFQIARATQARMFEGRNREGRGPQNVGGK